MTLLSDLDLALVNNAAVWQRSCRESSLHKHLIVVISSLSDDDEKDLSTVAARRRLPYDGMENEAVRSQETSLETASSAASTVTASVEPCSLLPTEHFICTG